MSKTKKIIWLIILFLAASAIVFGIAKINNNGNTENITLYFFNRDKSALAAAEKEIPSPGSEELYKNIAEALIKGPADKKYNPIMDKTVKLNRIEKNGDRLCIDFSQEYKSAGPLTSYAVIKTYCQLNDISAVKITAGGEDVNAYGYINGDDINLESDDDCATGITLYFADSSKTKLIKEFRKINITDTQPVEQYIINELLKGPKNKGNTKLLSSDTGVLSVETTDGTCYVNFKKDFITKNASSPDTEKLVIYSIVNSLTERDNIANVQFLIDGKKTDKFGGTDISELFYRNDKL